MRERYICVEDIAEQNKAFLAYASRTLVRPESTHLVYGVSEKVRELVAGLTSTQIEEIAQSFLLPLCVARGGDDDRLWRGVASITDAKSGIAAMAGNGLPEATRTLGCERHDIEAMNLRFLLRAREASHEASIHAGLQTGMSEQVLSILRRLSFHRVDQIAHHAPAPLFVLRHGQNHGLWRKIAQVSNSRPQIVTGITKHMVLLELSRKTSSAVAVLRM